MLSFDQLPPLTKAAVQEIRDMYGSGSKNGGDQEYRTWLNAYNKLKTKQVIMANSFDVYCLIPQDISVRLETNKSAVWWFKVIKEFKLMTNDIQDELVPYMLAGNGE